MDAARCCSSRSSKLDSIQNSDRAARIDRTAKRGVNLPVITPPLLGDGSDGSNEQVSFAEGIVIVS
jgi:hypothetical protein